MLQIIGLHSKLSEVNLGRVSYDFKNFQTIYGYILYSKSYILQAK